MAKKSEQPDNAAEVGNKTSKLTNAIEQYEQDGDSQILTKAIVQLAGPDPEEWPDGNEEVAEYRRTMTKVFGRHESRLRSVDDSD